MDHNPIATKESLVECILCDGEWAERFTGCEKRCLGNCEKSCPKGPRSGVPLRRCSRTGWQGKKGMLHWNMHTRTCSNGRWERENLKDTRQNVCIGVWWTHFV